MYGGRNEGRRRDSRSPPRYRDRGGRDDDRGYNRGRRRDGGGRRGGDRGGRSWFRRERDRSMSPGEYVRKPRMRETLFDVLPEGVDPSQLPPPGMGFAAPAGATYGAPNAPLGMYGGAQQTLQATRHARRIYVGGVPMTTNEDLLAKFFNNALIAINGTTGEEGPCVVNVYINVEKKFAFVEFRSVAECSNALSMDGVIIDGTPVRIRRPNDYNSQLAMDLGPSQPSPDLDLAAIGLDNTALKRASTGNILQEHEDRIFIGGLPYFLEEPQVRELLEAFGPIARFDLVRDKETGNSKGYGFVVYEDVSVTDIACQGLNGMQMGDKTLTVRRAEQDPSRQGGMPQMVGVPPPPPALVPPPSNPPSSVVSFDNMGITKEELADDEEYENIMEDMQEECGKHGEIVAIVIPRPSADGSEVAGMGKVFVQYASIDAATSARNALNGRKFGGVAVVADFLDEASFHSRNF